MQLSALQRLAALTLAALAASCAAGGAWAQEAAAAALRDLCPDRPTKSSGPCTVDAGHWQVEVDAFDEAWQRSGPATTDTLIAGAPTIKFGLNDVSDAEITLTPFEAVRTHDHATGTTDRVSGFGDLYLRYKLNLTGQRGEQPKLSVALFPYVKAPTAREGLGNGAWEGGLIVPVSVPLPAGWSLSLDPEVDVPKDGDGSGRHLNMVQLLSFGHPLNQQVTGYVELWSDVNWDSPRTVTQASFDLALSWIPPAWKEVQFDAGVNFGLNRDTPRTQVYAGVSRRF